MTKTLEHGPRAGDEAPWQDKSLLQELYVEKRLSAYKIGERLGCSDTTIYKWLDKFGMERREGSEALSIAQRRKPAGYMATERGYCYATTFVNDTHRRVAIHRLTAVAEYGFDALEGMHVHHENGVRWDNRPENLELMTPSEHSKLHADPSREQKHQVITKGICDEIRERHPAETQSELADEFGVTQSLISQHYLGKCHH